MVKNQDKKTILAVITLDEKKVRGGGAPVFLTKDQKELEKISLYLSRVLNGAIHDLENGVYIIVKH